MAMRIIEDDLSGPEIRSLLETHFAGMLANLPADSCHFLDFDGLNAPDVTFWSVWDDEALMVRRVERIVARSWRNQTDAHPCRPFAQQCGGRDADAHHLGSKGARISALESGDRFIRGFCPRYRHVSGARLRILPTLRGLCRRSVQPFHDLVALIGMIVPCIPRR